MAKTIHVIVPGLGIPNSDVSFLERIAKRLSDLVAARGFFFFTGPPVRGVCANVPDGDISQIVANALAAGLNDSGGPSAGFVAFEINSAGVTSTLLAPDGVGGPGPPPPE